jgi:GntR family carbon starvation induced transcriptional regulator
MSSLPEPLTNARTLAEHAYAVLREDIQAGRLAPGAKLRTSVLKERFGVSQGTIREALTRLVGDALVTLEGQRGFRVSPVSATDLHDLIGLRKLVEGEGLARSIRLGDDAWEGSVAGAFHELQRIESRLAGAIGAGDEAAIAATSTGWEEINARFHLAVISACGSPRLLKLYGDLYDQTARYRTISFRHHGNTLRSVDDEHRAIFEAVLSRDVAAAQTASAQHLQQILDFFEPHISGRNRENQGCSI